MSRNGIEMIEQAREAVKATEPASVPYVPSVAVDDMRARLGRAQQLLSQPAGDPALIELALTLANSERWRAEGLKAVADTMAYLQAKAAELAPDAPGAVPGSMLPRSES